ncbi:tetratricopeptide repeat protein [Amycolatopsis sp. FBCC-B4732]|uniref:ATP-binding protein n=1 Tax=Amycolatopsis sp. FBCC-B4732 TaxID=3079339 RepID=UPI001FF6741F|nr:tetratricopeptide repeat protein [Amycolatopsis sp. FBCC-B4732]UOX92370.1 tetratricopeptide repeat protein [Amycolatopsis sp. FBCC-B4732]
MVDEPEHEHGTRSVTNALPGTVTGSVVQAGTIRQVVFAAATQQALPVPRQLPPAVRDFAGRGDQLARLDELLLSHDEGRPGGVVISALDGTAGVGKTALAVQWAHRVEHHFTDGTLFADLRGYGPSAPVRPDLVLASFLHVLGIAEDRIPADLDAQVSVYRSVLAGRRVLILLDNAGTAEQVRPLLPGSPGCAVLVTSRASLTGLLVAEAASQLTLDLFTADEAHVLLRRILGRERVSAEPAAVADLVEVCARLPLALRIAATRIATRRHTSVAEVVADIVGDRTGLDVLSSSGDERSAVRSVFDWSYTRLVDEHAVLFRRLGLHPGTEFGVPAAAAVAGIDAATAYRHLEALADVHLIESVGGRRYRCHDLLHAYAAHRAERDDSPDSRRDATARLFSWYAHTAQAADKLVFPGLESPAADLAPDGPEVPLTDRAGALAWLNTEQANLLAVLRSAPEHPTAVVLAGATRFLSLGPRAVWPVRLEAETLGLRAAEAAGNRTAEALLLGFRGDTLATLERWDDAEADFTRQLALARELGDAVRQRVGLIGLGQVRFLQRRYPEARDYYRQALPLARQAGGGRPEAVVECNLSRIAVRLGEFGQAREHAERELVLRRRSADRVGEAYALRDVAVALHGLEDHDTAIEYANQAVALYRTLAGTEVFLAEALETAAASLERTGNLTRAAEHLGEACELLDELDPERAGTLRERIRELSSRG